jgi:hypothetical protein
MKKIFIKIFNAILIWLIYFIYANRIGILNINIYFNRLAYIMGLFICVALTISGFIFQYKNKFWDTFLKKTGTSIIIYFTLIIIIYFPLSVVIFTINWKLNSVLHMLLLSLFIEFVVFLITPVGRDL